MPTLVVATTPAPVPARRWQAPSRPAGAPASDADPHPPVDPGEPLLSPPPLGVAADADEADLALLALAPLALAPLGALASDGNAWAWGDNFFGQLGDGTTIDRGSPVQITALTGVVAIAAGETHSLAVKSDGTVWAWGRNGDGQLGNGTTANSSLPVQVSGLATATGVAAGNNHSLALLQDGTVRAWGRNWNGQLGDGTYTSRSTPVQVVGAGAAGTLGGVAAVEAGAYQSYGRKADGTLWAWGWGTYGQLGTGNQDEQLAPVQVGGTSFTGVASAAARGIHALARMADGTVRAWGDVYYGQLGDGTTMNRSRPQQVLQPSGSGALDGVAATSGGRGHTLALKADGTAWAWGRNAQGQLASFKGEGLYG